MAENFRKNPNSNDLRDTLRDLRLAGAINDQTQARLEDVLGQNPELPKQVSVEPINADIFSQISTRQLRNLRRVVMSAPGHSLNVDDLARLDEIIKIAQQSEAQTPKHTDLRPAMPSRRRMFEAIGWGILGTAILGTGSYGYTERKRVAAIDEIERRGREVMGRDFFGADAVKKTFGIHLPVERVPDIPFSQAEMERAKELDQFLILRTDVTTKGEPLTIKKMTELYSGDYWEKSKYFYDPIIQGNLSIQTPSPRSGWALVSKTNIHGSVGQRYIKQTELLIDYIRNGVFKSQPVPAKYIEAFREFDDQKSTMSSLLEQSRGWYVPEEVNEKYTSLRLNSFAQHNSEELIYDFFMTLANQKQLLLKDQPSRTIRQPTVSSEGRIFPGEISAFGLVWYQGGYWQIVRSGEPGLRISRRI